MLGDFINRILILILGYAYPGFECYKTVEKNRVDIEELRFWCKYWIIVALFTVMEKFTDIFVGWLPLYGEMKLVLFVYLWYPKTRGTGFVYENVLRPYVSKHETEIDRKLLEWKARGWDCFIYYWQYCAKFGQTAFVQALQHVATQSTRMSSTQKKETQGESAPQAQAGPTQTQAQAGPTQTQAQAQAQGSFMKQSSTPSKSKKWPPSDPVDSKKEHEHQAASEPEAVSIDSEDHSMSVKNRISQARERLKRLDSQNSQNSRSPRTPLRQQQF